MRRLDSILRTALMSALLLACANDASAQNVPWARSASMAGADFALTRGYAAIEWNPANLFLEDSVAFSFGSSIHGGRVIVTGAGITELGDIVTAAGVGSSSLLDGVPAEGLRIDAVSEGVTANTIAKALDLPDPSGNADVPSFGFTYKNGGLVVRQHTVLSALVSRELVDLAVNGFNPEQINEYAAKNTRLRSFTLTSATIGVGKRFNEKLTGGVGVRYVYGRKLMTGRVFEPEIDVDNELLNAAAAAIESRGGNGFGLDLGVTYEIRERLWASFALQNLWQRMYWSEQLWVSQSDFSQDDIGASDMRDIINRFRAAEFDSNATTLEAYAASQTLFEESFLPRVARAGIGLKTLSGTEVQLTGSKTWGPGTLIPVGPDRLALGVQHAWKALRFRGGVATESGGSRQIALGLGLNPGGLSIDLGGGWTRGTGASSGLVHGLSGSIAFGLVFTEVVS